MRIYEELFILRPDITEEDTEAYLEQIKTLITSSKGTVDKVEKWGVRKLAYRIEKKAEGFFVLIQFSTDTTTLVKEIERRMRVTDTVMKWITVRIDESLKKLEKRKLKREKRARRKPQPQAAPAAPVMPVAPALPSEAATVAPGQPTATPVAHPAPAAPPAAAPAATPVAPAAQPVAPAAPVVAE
jgi:small subunit ribosomal protein S6